MKPKSFREGEIRVSFKQWTDVASKRTVLEFASELGLRYFCNHGPQREWIAMQINSKNGYPLLSGSFPLCCRREYRRSDWARAAFFLWIDGKLREDAQIPVLPYRRAILESWAGAIGAPTDVGLAEVLADIRAIQTNKALAEAAAAAALQEARDFVESIRSPKHAACETSPKTKHQDASLLCALHTFGFSTLKEVTAGELKARFRAKALEMHPDRNGTSADFQRMQSLFTFLMRAVGA